MISVFFGIWGKHSPEIGKKFSFGEAKDLRVGSGARREAANIVFTLAYSFQNTAMNGRFGLRLARKDQTESP
jgi:hypothetical protein